MKRAIVTYADTPFYQMKMMRQIESVNRFAGIGVHHFRFTTPESVGCKPHSVVPYQFKPYSIDKVRKMGYEQILWIDSPIHVTKPLTELWDYIDENSYAFFDNIGHPLGKWTNQRALDFFNMSREEAMEVKMIMACCMVFDFREPAVCQLFDEYIGLSDLLYPGSWADHRHDQTVMSFLLHKQGFNIINGQETFFAYQNHHGVLPIADSVCLISE